MAVPQAILKRVAKLQPDDTPTQGVKIIVGGDGTRFFLIKDESHHWGVWQGTDAGLEVVYAPLPGLKHSDVGAIIPWDGTMIIYLLSRIIIGDKTYHPLHHLELTAPQFKAGVYRYQIDSLGAIDNTLRHQDAVLKQQDAALIAQDTALRQQIAALTQKVVEIEAALGTIGEGDDAALEGRVVALENVRARVREALGD